MKGAFNKEIVRSIRKSVGRFAAIFVISLLGAGFFAGLRMAAPDMRLAGDEFFDAAGLYDISVVSTLGLDDESLDILRGVEGATEVMATYQADELVLVDAKSYAARIESLPASADEESGAGPDAGGAARFEGAGSLNRPILVEGAWPARVDECVVGMPAANEFGIEIGDKLELEGGGEELSDTFATTSFAVCGLVNSPVYSASGMLGVTDIGTGEIDLYLYVEPQAFAEDLPFSVAYAACEGAGEKRWASEAYEEAVDAVKQRVQQQADRIGQRRRAAIVDAAQGELDAAKADYLKQRADAQAELADAERALDDARSQLDAAASQLSSGKAELDQSAAQLAAAQRALEEGEAEYAAGAAQLEANRAELAEGLAALDALKAALQNPDLPPEQRVAIEAQIAQIEQGSLALSAAEAQLAEARARLDAGWRDVTSGRAQRAQGEASYRQGLAEYQQGVADYESGRADLEQARADAERGFADAEAELADAQAEIDGIEEADVFVMDRSKNAGAASLASDAEGIAQIATFLPFMFFLVAALVTLTSMTRMVDEERLEIGTHKALGYAAGTITSKYLVYGALAAGVGSVVGVVLLGKLLPWFILTSYQVSYTLPSVPLPIDAPIASWAIGLSVCVALLATLASAAASLRESPAALMLPRAPKAGKRILLERIGPLWRRLSFSQKVTARNLLRYKKRFFMAVVGIAGCTALLVVGFGLRDAIGGIVSNQYEQLIRYDAVVRLDEDATAEQRQHVAELIDAHAASSLAACEFSMMAEGSADELRVQVVVPVQADELPAFATLRDRVTGGVLELEDGSVILSEKAAKVLGVAPGDEIQLFDENLAGDATGDSRTFPVGAIAENYLGHYVYLTPAGYRDAFGAEPSFDTLYVELPEGAVRERLSDELLADPAVLTVSFVADAVATYEEMLSVMDKLIVVVVALSAALAFVVLYNLTNINIGERIREIATLKVLGFTRRETEVYLFREVIVMALIGALIGCAAGVPLTFYIAEAAETANMMFGRAIEPSSFVLSFVITMAFSLIVALAMRGKVSRIDMVESLKSIE